jgi:hypothetical protein
MHLLTEILMRPELESFRRDGFLVVSKLLPPNHVAAVLDSINRTIRDQLRYLDVPVRSADLYAALRALHAADIDRYKMTLGALWRKEDVSALMRHPELIEFLHAAFGWHDVFLPGGEVALLMAADLKIPGGYFGLDAHQDFPSVQGSLDGIVAWIPLTDVDRNSWPIEVAPGSHRRGLITEVDKTPAGWQVRPAELADVEWVAVEAAAGDVVFMSVFTMHRSAREGDPRRLRIALSTRFDNGAEPTFIARGYPTAYQRNVHREQYLANFPDAAQIAALFG